MCIYHGLPKSCKIYFRAKFTREKNATVTILLPIGAQCRQCYINFKQRTSVDVIRRNLNFSLSPVYIFGLCFIYRTGCPWLLVN